VTGKLYTDSANDILISRMIYRSLPFSMTFKALMTFNPDFKATPLFDVEYIRKGQKAFLMEYYAICRMVLFAMTSSDLDLT